MSVKFDFTGKVVLITGSSSGIGAATAILFSKSGASVVVTGRNGKRVSVVAKQCREVSVNNSQVLEVIADITKEDQLKNLLNTTIQTFGKLDILVNNAGSGTEAGIEDKEFMSKYMNEMQTNLNSVIHLTHLSVEYLEKTEGNVINISSICSQRTALGFSPYCISKAGMDMFTRCMAAELGPKKIRINSICPGYVRTSFAHSDKKSQDKFYADKAQAVPLGRVGESEDIANTILVLASNQSSYITGAILVADGGHLSADSL